MSELKPGILAIDDTPLNLMTLGAALEPDFDLQIATTGAMGLALAGESAPDLILLDVMMPEMDGFEVCRRLKAEPLLRDIPVIFVTAANDITTEKMGLSLGAADYITKPINVEIARQRIRNLLERERLRQDLQVQITVREVAQKALLLRDQYQSALLDNFPFLVWLKDADGHFLAVNQTFAQACDCPSSELLIGKTDLDVWPRDLAEKYRADDRLVFDSGIAQSVEEPLEVNGRRIWFETYKSRVLVDGQAIGTVGFARDVTQRRQSQEQLLLAASVFTHAREGIMMTLADGTIIDVNSSFCDITGYTRHELMGKNPRMLSSGRQDKAYFANLWRSLLDQGYWQGEVWNRRKDGEVYAVKQTISAVRNGQGEVQHFVSLFTDITSVKAYEAKLEHGAHFDALTALPNRILLSDRLRQAMHQSARHDRKLAVVFLDLDGFKAINDNHGHEVGDQLLIALAARMKEALRDGDTLARIGGDEFVAVLLDLPDTSTSVPLIERLLGAAAQPVPVGALMLQVSASIGVTFYPQEQELDGDQLISQADQAMYQAKLAGKNRYHVFDTEQNSSLRGHHERLEQIRRALHQHEFVLCFQPQVNMRAGRVIGAEALLRWQHPQDGLLQPDVFLPVIEDHPLAVEVGEWVIDTALHQMAAWHAAGLRIPVSVNVGVRQLQQASFVERMRAILAAHPQVSAADLKLEMLEISALEDLPCMIKVIESCRAIGVTFALDDFGTGYSSLTYLKRLPVTTLKIDQSFVNGMLDDPDDLAILQGVLGLATAFHRDVIAVGVETVEHGDALLQLGCVLAQGFGIAAPMPGGDLPGWATAWRQQAGWSTMQPLSGEDVPLLFAVAQHRAWIAAIEQNVLGKTFVLPPTDQLQCRFGEWLHSNGQRYASQPAFTAVEHLHREAHALAMDLLRLHSSGQQTQAQQGLAELHVLRDGLLAQLKVLASASSSLPSSDHQLVMVRAQAALT